MMIRIIYDNNPFDDSLETSWGFACIIQDLPRTILFDTGGSGKILLSNMAKCGIKPEQIDAIVLSHIHSDHTGGLYEFLKENHNVEVFMPKISPANFKQKARQLCAGIVEIEKPCKICEGAWTTGVLDGEIEEQGLCLKTSKGVVVITGCAHPGIARISEAAKKHSKMPLFAVLGGFHMKDFSEEKIKRVIKGLENSGVRKVCPCHCSGSATRRLMKAAFRKGYLHSGAGAAITFKVESEGKAFARGI